MKCRIYGVDRWKARPNTPGTLNYGYNNVIKIHQGYLLVLEVTTKQ